MTSGRVVEAHRTFQDHTLDALSLSMALRYDGSNVGVVSFPSHDGRKTDSTQFRYLVLLMVYGYEETDWPMQ